jgi:hypothetical protein
LEGFFQIRGETEDSKARQMLSGRPESRGEAFCTHIIQAFPHPYHHSFHLQPIALHTLDAPGAAL